MSQTVMIEMVNEVDDSIAKAVAIRKADTDREEAAKTLRLGTYQRGTLTREQIRRAANPNFQWDDYAI